MTNLTGKLALVTGASSGLGAHFAESLALTGATVILAARREEALQNVAKAIRNKGGDVSTLALDVTSSTSLADLLSPIEQLDILVNNAGVVRDGTLSDQTEADWDVVVDTNLKGAYFTAKLAASAMRAHGRGGSIINIASILGLRQAGGVSPYAISKAGVIQMTKTLALELARYKIRVNALAPGYIDTDINDGFWESTAGQAMIHRIPQRRLGTVADLEAPLLLLASDASSYMTGSVLAVDGGHLVSTL